MAADSVFPYDVFGHACIRNTVMAAKVLIIGGTMRSGRARQKHKGKEETRPFFELSET